MCSYDFPCGKVRRVVLQASTFVVEECLNRHSFRREVPWQGGLVTRDIWRACAHCGTIFPIHLEDDGKRYCEWRCRTAARRAARHAALEGVSSTNI